MPPSNRRAYDIAASQQVQGDLKGFLARFEALIDQRQRDVDAARPDFQADGVSDDYFARETRWRQAADEVRAVIDAVQKVMGFNDETAQTTLNNAGRAVRSRSV